MSRWRESGRPLWRSEGRIGDSLLKVEKRETDAVLDENSEVLSFHHDRPVGENGAFSLPEEGRQGPFLRASFFIGVSTDQGLGERQWEAEAGQGR